MSGVTPAELPGDDDIILKDNGDAEPAPGQDEATLALWFLCGLSKSLIGVLVAMVEPMGASGVAVVAIPVDDAPTVFTGDAKERMTGCDVSPCSKDLGLTGENCGHGLEYITIQKTNDNMLGTV